MPTLEQIQAKLRKLKSQEETLIAKRNQSVLDNIRKLMEAHGLTTADIDAHLSTPRKRRGRPAGSAVKLAKAQKSAKAKSSGTATGNGKLPAKYRDPKTGATWSGWARPPLWIKDVKDRSKFLISGSTEIDPARKPAAKKVTRKNAAAKTAGAKKLTTKRAFATKAGRKSAKANIVNQESADASGLYATPAV